MRLKDDFILHNTGEDFVIILSHEGNDTTMITKMELVEGELGRFAMIRGE